MPAGVPVAHQKKENNRDENRNKNFKSKLKTKKFD